jgi:hypothetical protein
MTVPADHLHVDLDDIDTSPERLPSGRFLSRKDGSSHQARGEKDKADNGRRTAPEHLELPNPAGWRCGGASVAVIDNGRTQACSPPHVEPRQGLHSRLFEFSAIMDGHLYE